MAAKDPTKTFDHKHRAIALHSPAQRNMFFALVEQLGFSADQGKSRALSKFKKECFNDITSSEINLAIDRMDYKIRQKGGDKMIVSDKDKKIVCSDCSNEFIFTEAEQGFYADKGLSDPKRCKDCRQKRKLQRANEGQY